MRDREKKSFGASPVISAGPADTGNTESENTASSDTPKMSFAAFLASMPKDESDDGRDFERIQ